MSDRQIDEQQNEGSQPIRTRIDDHPLAAGLNLPLGGLGTFLYYAGFSDFRTSTLPWKISGILTVMATGVVLLHYLLNRHSRRLLWEGFVALFALVPSWLVLGSCWLFYFLFAPMPTWVRFVVLVPCLLGTAYWLYVVWKDYARDFEKLGLRERLYKFEATRIVYPGGASDMVVAMLKQRNPFTRIHFWIVTSFGPILMGIAMSSIEHFQSSSGPHAVFLILSFLSFPMSLWILAYLGVRTVFFHVFYPLKLERETGKKVILDP
jgi:uncharacterized membrane-anchored protein YitT (DUF2179 family)